MSTLAKVLIGLGTAFVLVALIAVMSLVGTYNNAVQQERGIVNQYEQNQNQYFSYFSKLKEVAQVPGQYANDLQNLFSKVVEGRKGSDGELVRFIKEANPTIDASIYKQIQQVIESGRDAFQTDQKVLLDKKRVYEVTLQSFPGNVILGMLGFPKIDMNKYGIVINDETSSAFETKRAAPIDVFPKKETK